MSQVLPLSKWAKEPLADREEFRSGDEDENFDAKDEESFKLPSIPRLPKKVEPKPKPMKIPKINSPARIPQAPKRSLPQLPGFSPGRPPKRQRRENRPSKIPSRRKLLALSKPTILLMLYLYASYCNWKMHCTVIKIGIYSNFFLVTQFINKF